MTLEQRLRYAALHPTMGQLTQRVSGTSEKPGVRRLVLLDLDHFKRFNDTFKRFNDTHGHQGGDLMLQSAAAAWATAPRATDTMFRYGGEEFRGPAARLPAEDAAAALERLREVTPLSQAFSAGLACWDRQKAAISATSSTGLTAARRLTLTDLDLQGL